MVRSEKLWSRGGQGCITIWELNLALCKSLPHGSCSGGIRDAGLAGSWRETETCQSPGDGAALASAETPPC